MNTRLITMDEVLDRVPFSKVHIYRLMQRGEFPRAVQVGAQRVAWVETEVDDWITARLRQREEQPQTVEAAARRALAVKARAARTNRAASGRRRAEG